MKSVLRTTVAILVAAVPSLGAQETSRRIEVGAALGVSVLPGAVTNNCGSRGGGDGGTEVGAVALVRFAHGLVAQVDTRSISSMDMFACAIHQPEAGTTFVRGNPRDQLTTSTMRLGLETPRSWPLFRLTAGAGVMWGAPPLPVGALSLAWSTRGEHARFFAELERMQTRDHETESRAGSASVPPEIVRTTVIFPVWHTLRIGVAWH